MRRFISILCAFALLISMCPAVALAAEDNLPTITEAALLGETDTSAHSFTPNKRGIVASVVTGNFGAVGFELLERSIIYSLGQASANTDGTISDVFKYTQRLLAGPQTQTLGQIKALCTQINKQVNVIEKDLIDTRNILQKAVQELQTTVDKNTYNESHRVLTDFYNKYLSVYNDYEELVTALNNCAENRNDQTLAALKKAYDRIDTFYTTSADPHTGKEFNFTSDLNAFLAEISPYPAAQKVDGSLKVSDPAGWGNKTGTVTYLDTLYDFSVDCYAFEHDIYRNMTAGVNEAAGYLGVYLTTYRMYVEYGAYKINSDPSLSDSEKQSRIETLWEDFSINAYRALRGIEQMATLNQNRLAGYMRPYDFETTMRFNYRDHYTELSDFDEYIFNDDFLYTGNWNTRASKTSTYMPVYQVKPVGGKRSYAILKGHSDDDSKKNGPTMTMNDLVYLAKEWMAYDYTGFTADFFNLCSSYTPGGYRVEPDYRANNYDELLSTRPYRLYNGHFLDYLRDQGVTNIPDVHQSGTGNNKDGNFLLLNHVEWDAKEMVVLTGYTDAHNYFVNVSRPLNQGKIGDNVVQLDSDDDIQSTGLRNQEFLTILLADDPKMALNWSASGGGTLKMYNVDANGNPTSEYTNKGGRCGTPLVALVKPNNGKVLKSLIMESTSSPDYKFDMIGNCVLLDDASSSASISGEQLLQYVDTDDQGYYRFHFPLSYTDTKITATFGDPDPSLQPHTVTLDESGGGEILFSSLDGTTTKDVHNGDVVEVAVHPGEGSVVKSVTATEEGGRELSVTEISNLSTPTNKLYQFTMGSKNVTVRAEYQGGCVATLQQPSRGGRLYFSNPDSSRDPNSSLTLDVGEIVCVAYEADPNYYLSEFSILGQSSYNSIPYALTDNLFWFEMPAENINIQAKFKSIQPGDHTVKLRSYGLGTLKFQENGYNTFYIERTFKPGAKVSFAAYSGEATDGEISVVGYSGKNYPVEKNGNSYSFTMENENVTVTLKHSDLSTVKLTKKGSAAGSLKFYGATESPLMTDSDTLASVRHGIQVFLEADCDPDTTDVNVYSVDASGSDLDLDLGLYALRDDCKIYSFIMPGEEIEIVAEFTARKDTPAKPGSRPTSSSRPTDRTPAKEEDAVCPKDATCPIHPFTDASADAWYHDGVHFCVERELMKGISDTTFAPEMETSRAMIATILWRLQGSPVVDDATDYSDVTAGAWYYDAVRWATSEGIVTGYGNGTFGPDDSITREQLAAMLWRYAKAQGQDVSVGEDTNILSYTDINEAAEWAIPALQWATGSGVITGKEGGVLDPVGTATRAEAAAMLQRYLQTASK